MDLRGDHLCKEIISKVLEENISVSEMMDVILVKGGKEEGIGFLSFQNS